MTYHTTAYILRKDDIILTFSSEKSACEYLGVSQCTVSSCYRRGVKCKGFNIEKVGSTSHGETKTRLHKIWECMHARCEYEKHPYFADYGDRGISVCKEWSEYVPFRDWAIANGYSDKLTLDRKNTNQNYTPENCRWATMKEQQNNKRTNRIVCLNGIKHTISEWSDILGINKTTIRERLNRGWSDEQALTTPVRPRTKGYRQSHNICDKNARRK